MRLGPLLAFALCALPRVAAAADADPSNYEAVVSTLGPGDTLVLAPGTYTGNLDITGLNGTADAPITILGPADKSARFTGNSCCNTVEITNSSYIAVKNLTIDGGGLDGVFGVSAKGGTGNVVHDITIEGCVFVGHGASQQTVAISTKAPTWGWVIRGNVIDGAGTGLYLGNSDGTSPFVDGVIEGNLVKNTVGYNMQVKFQLAWPAGVPDTTTSTLIRNNVFIKNDGPSPDGDRPNLLVGGFPEAGPGSENQYEIYGNFFFHNPREALLQASGRVSIHDNVFVDAVDAAIVVTDHDLPLRRARIYNNTIYSVARGIRFGNAASEGDFVVGNLVFAPEDVTGPAATVLDNLRFDVAQAPNVVKSPSTTLGAMDFYPLAGQVQGSSLDLTGAATDLDYDRDFNGTPKNEFTFRGAYAGEGDNPGWALDDGLKDGGAMNPPGTGGGGVGGDGAGGAVSNGGSGGSGGSGSGDGGGDDGCGCRVAETGRADVAPAWALLAGLAVSRLARRRKVTGLSG
ncbi:MAG: MYXO-CTERM sorting domain-containing protein [Polyangiaceae bacterium]